MTAPVPDHAMISGNHARSVLNSNPPALATKTWTFVGSIDNGFGWWKVFIDSRGALSILSDYGNWGMHWSRGGIGERTVLQFLAEADSDYLMGKLARRDWFDLDRSRKAAREALVEARRDLRVPHTHEEREKVDSIRAAWDALDAVTDEHDWNSWIMHEASDADCYELWNCGSRGFDPQIRAFFEKAWPLIVEQLRAEVERGETS